MSCSWVSKPVPHWVSVTAIVLTLWGASWLLYSHGIDPGGATTGLMVGALMFGVSYAVERAAKRPFATVCLNIVFFFAAFIVGGVTDSDLGSQAGACLLAGSIVGGGRAWFEYRSGPMSSNGHDKATARP